MRRVPHFAAAVAMVAGLVTGVMAAPFAGAVTVGRPQPELAQFKIHYAGTTSLSGGTVLADGVTVLASLDPSGTSISVCMMQPGDRACHSRSTLLSPGGDLNGVAVVTTGGSNVAVLTSLSGTFKATSFPVIAWDSSDDGASFGVPVVVSSNFYGLDSATVVNGQVVISVEDPHEGLDVQAIDPTGGSVATSYANVGANDDSTDIVTNDNGILLVAAENLNASGGTETDVFQASGSFDNPGSYSQVGTFSQRQLDGLSGDGILLNVNGSLTKIGKISFFNGTSFGTQYKVPDSAAGDDGYATLQQTGDDSGRSSTGVYNVFFEGRRNGYDLIEESTTNGSSWTPQTFFGSAIKSNEPTPVLSPTGAGVVFESGSSSQIVQPILDPVSVTITLANPSIRKGKTTTINGQMSIGQQGTQITLQKQLADGSWTNSAQNMETIPGELSFTVGTPGTYRAVVSTVPGWLQFGYSNAVTLKHKA